MSILSVDNISPIGSGTSVTVNNAATLVVNNLNASGVSTFSDIVDVTGSNSTVRLGSNASRRLMYRGGENDIVLEAASNFFYRQKISDTSHRWYTNGADEKLMITGAGLVGISSNTPTSPLEIHTNASAAWKFKINTSVSDGAGFYQRANGDFEMVLRDASNNINYICGTGGGLQFVTTGTEKLFITGIGSFGFGNSSPHRKVDIVGNSLLIRPTTASDAASGNANACNNSLILRMPYGQNAGSANNAGARIGIQFTGATDNANSWGYVDNPQKSASVYGVSEDTSAGYSRKMGLAFYTSPHDSAQVERVRISADGYVTKPYTPMFIAGRTGGNHTATVGTFPFNVTRINVGNHYSTSTYKFTAPVAGVYYFYAQVYYNNGSGQYRIHFRKENVGGGALNLNTSSHKAPSNDSQNSMSIIESLDVGDTVRLFSDQNHSIQCYYNINDATYGAHTYFMGYLIG